MVHMQLYSLEICSVQNSKGPVSHFSISLCFSSREKWVTKAAQAHLPIPLILL